MSAQQVKIYDEISSVDLVAPNLWEVDQCFSQNTFGQLLSIADTQDTEFKVAGLKKRLELSRTSSHFEFIDQIGRAMTSTLSTIVNQPLSYIVSKYWLDLPTFGCQLHHDSPEIFVSYQVYIGSALTTELQLPEHAHCTDLKDFIKKRPDVGLCSVGAEFTHVDPPIRISFGSNHGYINLNSDLKLHRVQGSWDTRLSVMFQYARV
jgi:hypothetical protein